jgi:hypothetical protein
VAAVGVAQPVWRYCLGDARPPSCSFQHVPDRAFGQPPAALVGGEDGIVCASIPTEAKQRPTPAYPPATHPTTAGAFGQGVFGAHDTVAAELAAWAYRPGKPEAHSQEAENASARLARRAPKKPQA